MLATTTVRLAHHVRLRHTVTDRSIGPLTARLEPVPYGWSLRVRGTDVVVAVRDGAPDPDDVPVLTVAVIDPHLAARLATPVVDVPLTAADITVDVDPAPMTLAVDLVDPDGAPRTGRTLTAATSSGPAPRPTHPLPEVTAGTYRTAPVTWTDAFVPLDLMVDGTLLRQLTVDLTRAETRVRLVDTT